MKSGDKSGKRPAAGSSRGQIFILEDHPATRRATATLIKHEPGMEVCGVAGNVKRALLALKTLKPDLVLTDLNLRGESGLDFIKAMKLLHPKIPVLVLSMHDKADYEERALHAGAKGYVMKTSGADALIRAIRRILKLRT
jgi:DNA-binding NarL/FixJ family response regulator